MNSKVLPEKLDRCWINKILFCHSLLIHEVFNLLFRGWSRFHTCINLNLTHFYLVLMLFLFLRTKFSCCHNFFQIIKLKSIEIDQISKFSLIKSSAGVKPLLGFDQIIVGKCALCLLMHNYDLIIEKFFLITFRHISHHSHVCSCVLIWFLDVRRCK